MPFVQRNHSDKITGVYASIQPGYAEEHLPDDDPEVISYLNPDVEINYFPELYALADFSIQDGSISSVSTSAQISAIFYIEVGTYWVFFAEPQSNTNYVPLCYNHNHTVFVSEKTEDFFVVSALSGGVPSDPMSLSVEVKRVQ